MNTKFCKTLVFSLLAGSISLIASQTLAIDLDPEGESSFEQVHWVGHLNPDSDAIVAAIGAAFLYGGIPTRTGPMNKESQFILNRFGVEPPQLVKDFKDKDVALVDFNQRPQLQTTIDMNKIFAIVDHHALRDQPVTLNAPVRIDIRPWGSATTILSSEMLRAGKRPSPPLAGILMSAILSDTVLLSSPTTTDHDRDMVRQLAFLAGIEDIQSYGLEMLKAKSDLHDVTDKDIITMDYKFYEINSKKIAFGVAETVNPEELLKRKQGFLAAMAEIKQDEQPNFLFFAVVDVLQKNSYLLLVSGAEASLANRAFTGTIEDQVMSLSGLISRKREFIPALKKALAS